MAISADGQTVAIGDGRGRVDLRQRRGSAWAQPLRLSVGAAAAGGVAPRLALSADGHRLVVGQSGAAGAAGAAVQWFERRGQTWQAQGAMYRASSGGDQFGASLAMSADGGLLAVGARLEALRAGPAQAAVQGAGAVHMFALDAG